MNGADSEVMERFPERDGVGGDKFFLKKVYGNY